MSHSVLKLKCANRINIKHSAGLVLQQWHDTFTTLCLHTSPNIITTVSQKRQWSRSSFFSSGLLHLNDRVNRVSLAANDPNCVSTVSCLLRFQIARAAEGLLCLSGVTVATAAPSQTQRNNHLGLISVILVVSTVLYYIISFLHGFPFFGGTIWDFFFSDNATLLDWESLSFCHLVLTGSIMSQHF